MSTSKKNLKHKKVKKKKKREVRSPAQSRRLNELDFRSGLSSVKKRHNHGPLR